MNNLRIVVAGHVDHGKSTLIGRLLYDIGALPQQAVARLDGTRDASDAPAFAFVTDQLSEEQEGSFTLDTAQAYFRMAGREYTLIDTPGHREFLKNMVTGTTRADAAILVVDADEGPLAQTYLHAYLIAMLGIQRVIVVINKMDSVSYSACRFDVLSQQMSEYLAKAGMDVRAVIPISAQRGDCIAQRSRRMPWNESPPLMEALEKLTPRRQSEREPLRFPVQCTFSANNRKAVLGRVVSGHLRQGQTIVFGPNRHRTFVASVLLGRQEAPLAVRGQSVALLLEDPVPVERGQIGSDVGGTPCVTKRFSARVFWIAAQPLQIGDRIEVLCGTQNRSCRVEIIAKAVDPMSLETAEISPPRMHDTQVADIVIQSDTPMCVDLFERVPELGRLALLQNGRIAGGGVVQMLNPPSSKTP